MPMSLAVMVLSLVATAGPWEALLKERPPTNAERAKRGLLPRRSRPSKVTYLDGAARRRGEVREFAASVPPPPLAVPVAEAERGEPIVGAGTAARGEPAEHGGPVEDGGPVEHGDPVAPAPAVASSAVEEAADRARDAQAASEAMVVERSVDLAGRILERRLGREHQILSVRVVATIDELPVLSSLRAENGEIVERVEDRTGILEVRRDPVGRFLSARALAPPGEDG